MRVSARSLRGQPVTRQELLKTPVQGERIAQIVRRARERA